MWSRAWPIALALAVLTAAPVAAQQEPQVFSIGVLRKIPEPPAWQTALTAPPEDDGIAGARLGIKDNETTGAFLNQAFPLTVETVGPQDDPMPAFQKLVEGGSKYIVLDVPADDLLRIADSAPEDVILFNAGARDDRLRNEDCRANVYHTAPSRSMLTDALAQYLAVKRWSRWLLIVSTRERDRLYADAVRGSAAKFGSRIVEERVWNFGPDTRRTAQSLVPTFTQNVDYDIAVIADEQGEFGDLILYHTWDPRPTAGTQGLTPASWHPAVEAWGAVQLQSRFIQLAHRLMGPLDYQFWIAVRAVGQAATKVQSADIEKIRQMLNSPDLDLGGHKGAPLSFREWDHQLRQPIPLAHPAALVSTSPQEGFLHQRTPLDTLGTDQPETRCQFGG